MPRAGVFSGASNPSWKGGRDYHQNKAEFCAKAKTHYRANRERILERRKEMRTPEQRKRDTAAMRVRHVKLRAEVLKAYGGKCACCGESESLFLELDHVNGRGNEHRRQIGRGSAATYRHLKKLGWPKADFQILCANCNAGSARNGGVCPHAR